MKKIGLALASVIFAAPLNAETITTTCERSRHAITCTTSVLPALDNSAKIISVAPRADDAEREAAWIARCQPRLVRPPAPEATYYVYGNPDCGRTR